MQISQTEDRVTTKFVAKPTRENIEQSSEKVEGNGKERMKKIERENTVEFRDQSNPDQSLGQQESQTWEHTWGKNLFNLLACCTKTSFTPLQQWFPTWDTQGVCTKFKI
jgi:hypothetical protein